MKNDPPQAEWMSRRSACYKIERLLLGFSQRNINHETREKDQPAGPHPEVIDTKDSKA